MTQEADIALPRIKRVVEVGETPFQFLGLSETILQGWSPRQRRNLYLFKSDEGVWSYYDKETQQVLPATKWKGRAVDMGGEWVKMGKYHRLKVHFLSPVTYTEYTSGGNKVQKQTQQAEILVSDSAYISFGEAAVGRPVNSAYKLSFTERKKKDGGKIVYVDKIVWAEELPAL